MFFRSKSKEAGGLPSLPPPASTQLAATPPVPEAAEAPAQPQVEAPPPAKRLLVGRHNGIGDLVMAIPFIAGYMQLGYDVTVSCDKNRHTWLPWLLPGLKVVDCLFYAYTDFNQTVDGYDVYLNLNKVEEADVLTRELGLTPINLQHIYSIIASQKGLPRPPHGLAPCRYIEHHEPRGDHVLVFTQSTHPSRSLAPQWREGLRGLAPNAIIDPQFEDTIELCKAIASAREVIGVDSGAIHLAEALRTPWRVLHTTMDFAVRNRFYDNGRAETSWQAPLPCSPCYSHGGCDNVICTASFPLEAVARAARGEGQIG